MVSNNKTVKFTHFRRNELWYVTECGFAFAVPADDVGDATFNNEERAMLMMRYIRKQVEANTKGLVESLASEPTSFSINPSGVGRVVNCS
jgi:hypothetical protein